MSFFLTDTRKNKKGFTLLELMAVIAIMGILTTITLVSLSSGRKNKASEAAGREITSVIREAQHAALTGKRLDTSHFPCYFSFIKDDSDPDDDSFKITYHYHSAGTDCSGTLTEVPYAAYEIKGSEISDFALTPAACAAIGNEIKFDVPYGLTNFDCDGAVVSIEITPAGESDPAANICVYSTGNIIENAGDVPC